MRRSKHIAGVFLGLMLVLMAPGLQAQSEVRFEEVSSINDLSHNNVTCLLQDRLGFLWMGTFNGLNKYDGYRFRTYHFNSWEGRAASNRILSLREDRQGLLWVKTYDGRYQCFNPATETFLTFPQQEDENDQDPCTNFFETEEGMVCLSTEKSGAIFIRSEGMDDTRIVAQLEHEPGVKGSLASNHINFIFQDADGYFWIGSDRGLNRIHGDALQMDDPPVSLFHEGYSFHHYAVHDGMLWFGNDSCGLMWYNPVTENFSSVGEHPVISHLSGMEITTLRIHGEDLWIGTASGSLFRHRPGMSGFTEFNLPAEESGRRIKEIYCDRFNQVWIITEAFGITRLAPLTSKFSHYKLTPEGYERLTDDERVVIMEDSRNQLWLGGQNLGIQHYERDEDRFTVYTNFPDDPTSLSSGTVECILEDRENNIWIGTSWFGKGLNRMITLDQAFQYVLPVPNPEGKVQNVVRSLLVDSNGYIWAGTKDGHIYIHDGDLNEVHVIRKDARINYSGYNVYSITEDQAGRIWLCTKGAGIFYSEQTVEQVSPHYERLTFKSIQKQEDDANSLNNNNIYDLVIDELGRIWVATYGGGLNLIERDGDEMNFRHFTVANSNLNSDKVRDLHLDHNGRLWMASTLGVNYVDIYDFDQETARIHGISSTYGQEYGLSYGDVIMVMEDKRGHLWLATAGGGINRILNPDEDDFRIEYLSKEDGLKDDYILSITEDIYGFIWIGTLTGISRFNPMNGDIENFDKKNGLPEVIFSERTSATTKSGKVLLGTVKGFYSISPDQIEMENVQPAICLTGLMLNNREITPGEEDSPISRSISYEDGIRLRHDQSDFSIVFSMLSFKSPESNHYAYNLEGFSEEWNYMGTENKATFTNVPGGNYVFRVKGLNSDRSEFGKETSLRITVLPPAWKTKGAIAIYVVLLLGMAILAYRLARRFISLKNNLKVEKMVAESKLRFFTNISHEIRTPLTLILGPMDNLISRTDVSTEVRHQLAVAHRNSKRLLRMVNQILDFRKAQNEKVSLRIQEIEVIPFLNQIHESFEAMASRKNITFKLIYDQADEDLLIWGDIQKLDIVIFNLLSNAFKFTSENGRISIMVSRDDEDEDLVTIQISDTGVGIAREKLDLIFNRFFVSHTGESDSFQGTGIGLSLSQEYIKLHQGTIQVESEEGIGTDFIVKLRSGNDHFPEDVIIKQREAYSYTPKVVEMEEVPLSDVDDMGAMEDGDDKASLLIVEDDVEMCHYLKKILEDEYHVEISKDGSEGFEKAIRQTPDLIVTDVMMPGMNGIEMTRRLKEEFITCHIPVIILSSRSAVESQVEGLNVGAEAYLPKPFDARLLISYIQSFLAQRRKVRDILESKVELKPDEVKVSPRDKEFIEKVLRIIDERMGDPSFNVEKLAAEMYISRTLFYKKIKGITGYQPVELIRTMRLKKAAQYIGTGEFTVSEVAYKVGYNDIRYFSTCFKKQFGSSPSQFELN